MRSDLQKFVLEAIKAAGANIYSFVALLCFLLTFLIYHLILSSDAPRVRTLAVFLFILFIAGIFVFLYLSSREVFRNPQRIIYGGADRSKTSDYHVGTFRKVDGKNWVEEPLRPDDDYFHKFVFERQHGSRIFLRDLQRGGISVELDLENRTIWWYDAKDTKKDFLYSIIAIL